MIIHDLPRNNLPTYFLDFSFDDGWRHKITLPLGDIQICTPD